MIIPPSDPRQLVPIQESAAILRLVEHDRSGAGTAAPTGKAMRAPRRERRADDEPMRQPTPAECYGCVDWFQF